MSISTSPILWHGSTGDGIPDAFRPIWLTGDPSVAAIHSGASGRVHAFSMREGTRVLRAIESEGDGDGRIPDADRPDADVWRRILALMDEAGQDPRDLPCLDEDRIERFMSQPLGPDGQPTWASLVDDLRREFGDAALDPFASLGFDAIAVEERTIGALHLRRYDPSRTSDPAYARFLSSHSGFAQKNVSVSVRIATGVALEHAGSFEPLAVAWIFGSDHRPYAKTEEEDIRSFFVGAAAGADGPGFG